MTTDRPPKPTPPDTRTLPLHETIARQAYSLWESYGRPEGRDVAIWLEAERQALGTDAAVRTEGGGPAPAGPLAASLYPNREPNPGVDSEPAALPPNGPPRTVR